MTSTHNTRRRLDLVVAFLVLAIIGLCHVGGSGDGDIAVSAGRAVDALPLYSARAERTCDNCHADPTGWSNPALALRKCSLSCVTCHVNPTGGGLRNASGRYYSQATLPLWFPSHRPDQDRSRQISFLKFVKTRKNRLWDPAVGRPIGGSATLAPSEKRYNGLRGDPFVLFGLDTRYAFWFTRYNDPADTPGRQGQVKVFPMQIDLHVMVHPYRWITAYATAGVLAKSKGYPETFGRSTPFMVKDTFIMLHQLPYQGHLRVGRFIPSFGHYIDDHTSPIRRDFELDSGLLHGRVMGAELGLSAGRAYFITSFFRPSENETFGGDENPSFFGTGWGTAMDIGWRDFGWSVGVSGLVRRRDLERGGHTEALSIHWTFNPWAWRNWLPMTYLGQVAVGGRRHPISERTVGHLAAYHEIDVLIHNGVNLRFKYDFADPDTDIEDDHYHRLSWGGDLVLLPGFAIRGEFRLRLNAGSGRINNSDGLLYFRGWY